MNNIYSDMPSLNDLDRIEELESALTYITDVMHRQAIQNELYHLYAKAEKYGL